MKSQTQKSQSVLWLALFVGGCALAACQGLADEHTSAPPLASIRGTLSLAPNAQAPTGDVKLAILWDVQTPLQSGGYTRDPSSPCAVDPDKFANADFGGTERRTISAAQQVSVATMFPVEFTLHVAEPPPPEALRTSYDWSGRYASGELVVYRDANANGMLDPSTFQQSSPDELLSVSAAGPGVTYTIVYADRKPVFDLEAARRDGLLTAHESASDREYGELEAGYNLIAWDPADPLLPMRLSDDASIALELEPAPILDVRLCEQICEKPDGFICPADPRDLPPIPEQAAKSPSGSYSSWRYSEDGRLMEGIAVCVEESPGEHYFGYVSSACEGCVCVVRRCGYQANQLPEGASLPCAAYE